MSPLLLNEGHPQVDVLCGQHPVALYRVGERKFLERRLKRVRVELELVDDRIDERFAERSLERHERHENRALWARLQHELVAQGSGHRVNGVLLVVIHPGLHGPLEAMSVEATRLVEQLRNKVVRAER